jgi:hypothetical protein
MVCLTFIPCHLVLIIFEEIDPEVDYDARRAVYFRQMRYGLFVSVPAVIHNLSAYIGIRCEWLYWQVCLARSPGPRNA